MNRKRVMLGSTFNRRSDRSMDNGHVTEKL